MNRDKLFIALTILFNCNNLASANFYVSLSNDGPIVRGATIHFEAHLYDSGEIPSGSFRYDWVDNGIKQHKRSKESTLAVDLWNVTYPANEYPMGEYDVQVTVYKYILVLYYPVASQRITFNITETLNGDMILIQRNETFINYVSNASPVKHEIALKPSDAAYLNHSATSMLSYWFVDCVYYGPTSDFTFMFNYTQPEKQHSIEALVVAGFDPITTPAPSTTTTTPTPTTPTTTTTTKKSNISSIAPITTVHPDTTTHLTIAKEVKLLSKRAVSSELRTITSGIMVNVNGTLVPYNGSFPFVCLNNTVVAPEVNKTYGYFSKKFVVKAPVVNFSVTGNNWLQHGEVLSLLVKCDGSGKFNYCYSFKNGLYNVTGKENCTVADIAEKCEFPIQRYFSESKAYTIVIIIYNDVSKIVSPVTVTVYKVTKQPQLSVIVVPVAFSIVAVILIVFGVAYYLQNRSRFIVEVADFNFGQQYSDMEYKTFNDRLRESIVNAFTRAPTPGSPEPTAWPPGHKYGSLT